MAERIQNYLFYVFGSYNTGKVLVELLLIGVIVYSVIRFLRGTGGERLLKGLVILLLGFFAVSVITREWELERIDLLFKSFLVAALMVALVAFQPELRRGLMRLGGTWIGRHSAPEMRQVIEQIVDAAAGLSHDKIGALIALEREVPLGDLMHAGTAIDADVTAELLRTIFWPGSPLHDMGVVIRGQRAAAAAVQFPLAEHGDFDRTLGSRHRAAVGLSKTTDAVVVLVSEETGQIALATDGKLTRFLTLEQLRQQLLDLMMPFAEKKRRAAKSENASPDSSPRKDATASPAPAKSRRPVKRWPRLRTALIVIALSAVIWVFAERAVIKKDDVAVRITLPTAHRDLLLQYTDSDKNVLDDSFRPARLTVEGPSRTVQQDLNTEYEQQIILDIEKLGYEPAGAAQQYCSVPIISLLGGRLTFDDGAHFRIIQTDPVNLHVRVSQLTQRALDVIVFDESNNQLTTDQQLTIEAYAPAEEGIHAQVILDDLQQAAAMKNAISVNATVEFAHRKDDYPISVKLTEGVAPLPPEKITAVQVAIVIPVTMYDEYHVVIDDMDSVLGKYSPIQCRGPGFQDYRDSPYHLQLIIEPGDKTQETRWRRLRYNHPPDVEIIDPKDDVIGFHLVPRETPAAEKVPERTP